MKNTILLFAMLVFYSCADQILSYNDLKFKSKSIEVICDFEQMDSISNSYLPVLVEQAYRFSFKDIYGNDLLELKEGKINKSKMRFIYHYKYDMDLVRKGEIINLENAFVFNPNAITILFFKSDKKKEIVGFAEGRRHSKGIWSTKYGLTEHLYSEVDRYNYYLNRFKDDELIAIDIGTTYFGYKSDGGNYFELKQPITREEYVKKKKGIQIDDKIWKFEKNMIKKILRNSK